MEISINEHVSIHVDMDEQDQVSSSGFLAIMDLVTKMLKVAERQTGVVESIRKPYNGGMPRKRRKMTGRGNTQAVRDLLADGRYKNGLTVHEIAEKLGFTNKDTHDRVYYLKSKNEVTRDEDGRVKLV